MSLFFARARLTVGLKSNIDFSNAANAKAVLQLAEDWWVEYKKWEAADTFKAAMSDGRMTVSQRPYKVIGELSMVTLANPSAGKLARPGVFNVSPAGVKLRSDPANFEMSEGERGKYKHGLHDLSGSLLNAGKPLITQQLNSKWGKLKDYCTVFTPVPQMEDLVIFNLLNIESKRLPGTAFYQRVQYMRRRMTRIKLAQETDMFCGFVDVNLGGPNHKYRYGLGLVKDDGSMHKDVADKRKRDALNYQSILNADKTYNEIIIAYRQHESGRFPLFCGWDKGTQTFVCADDEPTSKSIPNGRIPDAWATLA